MLSLSGQELSSPCEGWDVEQRQMSVLQLLHGGEEPLKHRKGLVWGWVGSQERERWFGGVCSHNCREQKECGGFCLGVGLKCGLYCLGPAVKLCMAERG